MAQLKCRQCGNTRLIEETCSSCGNKKMILLGFGEESAAEIQNRELFYYYKVKLQKAIESKNRNQIESTRKCIKVNKKLTDKNKDKLLQH
jgi:primosomal protein N'